MKEQWQQVLDSSVFAQQWSKTIDLIRQCSTDVLRWILTQFFHTGNDSGKYNLFIEELGEALVTR